MTATHRTVLHERPDEPILRVRDLSVQYGKAVIALDGVSLDVAPNSIVAVLGSNGAGKSTLLRTLSGVLGRHKGKVVAGEMELCGSSLNGDPPDRRVKAGLVQVPEGRRVFNHLTVEENLRVGRFGSDKKTANGKQDLERVFTLFPVLGERRRRQAAYLSGGEQQMLAIGRALMASPRVLLLDEPSLGLAPRIVEVIVELLEQIRREGTALLLVEQNAKVALDLADFAYVLSVGRIALGGAAEDLKRSDTVRRLYLGHLDE